MKNLLFILLLMGTFNSYSQTKNDTLSADEKKKIKRELILKQMKERSERAEGKLGKSKKESVKNDSIFIDDKATFETVLEKNKKAIQSL